MIDFKSKFGRFANKHIKKEYFIWLTTVDSTGTPQPKPVWFIWENDSFLIFSQAKAHKVKHIQKNPNVSLHFNTTDDKGEKRLIIFTGTALINSESPPANRIRAYMRKYKSGIADLNATPEQFAGEYSVAIRIHPTKVRGWE
ncbi:MAG TPA: TIGR03667 family PPOX class F420-dependent oxidoreductase [Anaerolineales bacterium]|nr:TIGR03667 family PPOX class F420-dependent oxidoreductase [Anaerolineales bacterium]